MVQSMLVELGGRVVVVSATGKRLARRACSGIETGHTFPVVWVCNEDEWMHAAQEGRRPQSIPWPAESVEGEA